MNPSTQVGLIVDLLFQNSGPFFQNSGPLFQIVDLYFLRAVCPNPPNPPGYGPALDMTTATLPQLVTLPAEVHRLHLSARSLVTMETKSVMARRLYTRHYIPCHQLDNSNVPPSHTTFTYDANSSQ